VVVAEASPLSAITIHRSPRYAVVLDELPKNPSGKVLKRTLRERFTSLGDADVPSATPRLR
jgi:acyl-coenzyme A synthetase/AMP-(fatty) acid ligase